MLSKKLRNLAEQLQAHVITRHLPTREELEALQAVIADAADQAEQLEKGRPPLREVEDPFFPKMWGDNIRPIEDARKRRETRKLIAAFTGEPA